MKTTTGLVYKDKDTKAGYKYSYTVKAYKLIDGKKVYSGYDKIGLSGKLNTTVSLKIKNNTVSVSWKKTNGASGYYIYRATSKKGKYSKIKIITSGKTLKYTDKKVKKGKTYYYKVVPFRKISGKAVKGASSAVKSIAFKKKDVKPTESQSSAWKYPEAVQKLIDYLIKNGRTNTSEVVTSKTSGAKKAVLDYEVIHQISDERTESGKRILIKIHLETGRHHQIRVQLSHAGIPLLGDRKYNPSGEKGTSLGLCSCGLEFKHPKTGKIMKFETEPQGTAFLDFVKKVYNLWTEIRKSV